MSILILHVIILPASQHITLQNDSFNPNIRLSSFRLVHEIMDIRVESLQVRTNIDMHKSQRVLYKPNPIVSLFLR